jgi:hypothetical protein
MKESRQVLPEFWTKLSKRLMILPGLMAGILIGLLIAVPLDRHASAPSGPSPDSTPLDIARLSPTELEALALKLLTALREKRGPARVGAVRSEWNEPGDNLRQIHLGMKNVRRLLPLGKRLALETFKEMLKTSRLSREKRLIGAVHRILLDPRLTGSAEVWEDDLSVIYVGPGYAAYLTSNDEAMLLLGHELTHVAVRAGRLNNFIRNVNDDARSTAALELDEGQKEELACDYIGAEVLKRYIALNPTPESDAERFSRAFGYEPPAERLAHAWQEFCASYNGEAPDEQHLSQDQTLRALLGLDPELKPLIPDDAISIGFCR